MEQTLHMKARLHQLSQPDSICSVLLASRPSRWDLDLLSLVVLANVLFPLWSPSFPISFQPSTDGYIDLFGCVFVLCPFFFPKLDLLQYWNIGPGGIIVILFLIFLKVNQGGKDNFFSQF
uniref:Uncharacterized protein n=1 Tax=Micrurus surinamensis TaxID=129470 RepID=A0A2D4PJP7_MICSU